ncbi:MAG: ATP-NAD/AcoX kinase [Frankiales bacterium]|nr:ATP-NAD/AcoX kinase [Frankiales bacterium]
MTSRRMLLVVHTGRADARDTAVAATARLREVGIEVLVLGDEAGEMSLPDVEVVPADPTSVDGSELVLVLGGDGSLLRAAELARPSGTPILGVNLGRVAFLAETEQEMLPATIERIISGDYEVEDRLTLDVTVTGVDGMRTTAWALNEASIERADRKGLLEFMLAVDGRPLSRWGGDGVVIATPTGSTAYAFSAGGPVMWPAIEALLVVPIAVHALFNRPLVVGPDSVVAVEIAESTGANGLLMCDGRRRLRLEMGAHVEVRRGAQPVRLATLYDAPFTDRLVRKFALPIEGWRG